MVSQEVLTNTDSRMGELRSFILVFVCALLVPTQVLSQEKMSVTTSKPSYDYGETIVVSFRVWNDGGTPFSITVQGCDPFLRPDTVTYDDVCDPESYSIQFNPGDSWTWIWHIFPSAFGYPTFSGEHRVVVYYGVQHDTTSTTFDAPAYRGGPLLVYFLPGIPQSVVDSITVSLNADLVWSQLYLNGIVAQWQVTGYPVDSLALAISKDSRVQAAEVPRELYPDSAFEVGVPIEARSVPEYELQQNYPNPFNPTTTIKFELPKSSMVRLSVYDILGRQVTVLVNENKAPGSYEVKFDGSNLASGMYIYRIQARSFVQTRKLLLLK